MLKIDRTNTKFKPLFRIYSVRGQCPPYAVLTTSCCQIILNDSDKRPFSQNLLRLSIK